MINCNNVSFTGLRLLIHNVFGFCRPAFHRFATYGASTQMKIVPVIWTTNRIMDDLREFFPPVGTWRLTGYMALSSPSPVSVLAPLGSIRPLGSFRLRSTWPDLRPYIIPTRLGFQPEMTSVRLSSVSRSVKKTRASRPLRKRHHRGARCKCPLKQRKLPSLSPGLCASVNSFFFNGAKLLIQSGGRDSL